MGMECVKWRGRDLWWCTTVDSAADRAAWQPDVLTDGFSACNHPNSCAHSKVHDLRRRDRSHLSPPRDTARDGRTPYGEWPSYYEERYIRIAPFVEGTFEQRGQRVYGAPLGKRPECHRAGGGCRPLELPR